MDLVAESAVAWAVSRISIKSNYEVVAPALAAAVAAVVAAEPQAAPSAQ